VDAYEGTAAERAFHDVLRRGGVIGGGSAGASIQSEYMLRGDPLGNRRMMAEGYERGFGFLKGTAIDQHFFARKRQRDMTALMKTYPQLLGLGIDEGAAAVVQGSVMEVIGRSKVAVYDTRKPAAEDGTDYEELPVGARYDLKKRQRIKGRKR
jgi:cyanophycinase